MEQLYWVRREGVPRFLVWALPCVCGRGKGGGRGVREGGRGEREGREGGEARGGKVGERGREEED